MATLGAGTAAYHAEKQAGSDQRSASGFDFSERTQTGHTRPDGQAAPEKKSAWKRAGSTVGAMADTKDKMADTIGQLREQAKDLPVNAKYAFYHRKEQVSEGTRDFTSSMTQTRTAKVEQQNTRAEGRRQTIAERRTELEQAKQTQKIVSEAPKGVAPVHKCPVTAKTRQSVSPAIRGQGQASYGGAVAERASVPVVKAVSIHHEQIPPVRIERQIAPPTSLDESDERQKVTPVITPAAPRPVGLVQNDTAPMIPKGKRAAPVVEELNFTIWRTTARKKRIKTGKTAAKQKKREKTWS